MKMKKAIAVLMAAALVFTVTACGGGDDSGEAKDSLTIAINADATTLDPIRVNDTVSMSLLSNVFEPMVRMSNDAEIVPAMAEKWDISDDGKVYTFTIRNDVTFHDGDPVTAEDVKYSLEAAAESPYSGPYMGSIDTVDIVDDTTIKVTLKYPNAPFLSYCTIFSPIVKKGVYEEDSEIDMDKNPVGSGPFKLKNWAHGDKIEFEAYDGYYQGAPAIKNLTYKVLTNENTTTLALESGEVDVCLKVATTDIKRLEEKDGITLLQQPSTSFYTVVMNTEAEELQDVRVRRAIAKCINKQDMIDGVVDGYGKVTNSFLPEGVLGYTEGFDPLPYDVEGAKELMKEAGYENGFKLTMLTTEGGSTRAQILKADLAQIGIELQIDLVESGKYWEDLEQGEFSICVIGWSYIVPDPDNNYTMYKKGDTVGNFTRYGTDETDALLNAGRSETDPDKRAEIYAELEEIVQTDAAYVPLYWCVDAIAFNSDLTGVELSPNDYYYVYNYAWK